MKQYCRICFVYDVRMQKFGDTAKREFIASIFEQHGYNKSVKRGHYLCYICDALLSKSYNFIERVLRAQQVFHDLVNQNDLITALNMLQDIDRCKQKLNYTNLSINTLDIGSVDDYEGVATSIEVEIDAHLNYQNNINADDDKHGYTDVFGDPNDNIDSVKPVQGSCTAVNNWSENTEMKEIEIKLEHPYTFDVDVIHDPLDGDMAEDNDAMDIKTDLFIPQLLYQCNDDEYLEIDSNTVSVKNKIDLKRKRKKRTKVGLESTSSQYVKDSDFMIPKEEEKVKRGKRKTIKQEADTLMTRETKTNKRRKRTMETVVESSSEESEIKDKIIKRRSKVEENLDRDYMPNSSESVDSECEREYPMTCAHCDSLISSKMEHYHHYLESHQKIKYPYAKTGSLYICEICGASMNYLKHLQAHLLKHGEKTLQCTKCTKMYHTKTQLSAHNTRVHGPKKFVCDYCDKRFPEKHTMRLHIRTHTGQKPFKCHICSAAFAHGGNRLLHIRVKHQNQPYPLQEKQEKRNEEALNQEAINQESLNQEKKTRRKVKQRKRNKNYGDGDTDIWQM